MDNVEKKQTKKLVLSKETVQNLRARGPQNPAPYPLPITAWTCPPDAEQAPDAAL